MNELSTLVKANVGTPITITMLRNGETVDIQLTPRLIRQLVKEHWVYI